MDGGLVILVPFLLAIGVLFFIPLPYGGVIPGTLLSANEIVHIDKQTSEDHFFVLTADFYENPYSLTANTFHLNLYTYFLTTQSSDADLFPVPYSTIDSDDIKEQQYSLSNQTLSIAQQVAFDYLNITQPSPLTFSPRAGSSASLMITLEIINQLGDSDLIRERRIAGTGEIHANGSVGK